MNGSLGSVTVHLLEQHPQPLARSFHSHFEGGNTDTGYRRHLVIPQLFHVLQQECFPLVSLESLQGSVQFFSPCRALGRVIFGGAEESDFVVDKRALPATPPSSGSPAAIGQDAKEPRSESLGFITLGQRSKGSDEGILQRLFRVLPATEHSHGITTVLNPVTRHDHGIGPGVSSEDTSHDCGITVVL
jgi:hypothetical protein